MNQPSEHENGRQSGKFDSQPSELALRLAREPPSSQILDSDTAAPSFASRSKTSLSSSEAPLPLTPSTSSRSKSRSTSNIRAQSHDGYSVSSRASSPSSASYDSNQGYRQIIVRSFAPRVAVYASADTNDLIRQKGFKGGLCDLVRPFGERLPGKVFIRDSVGASKGFDDFGIRFVDSGDLQSAKANHVVGSTEDLGKSGLINGSHYIPEGRKSSHGIGSGSSFDQLLDHDLHAEGKLTNLAENDHIFYNEQLYDSSRKTSPMYSAYLRKLLADETIVPYETFSHPVACMIAVSSHHPAPIEALRQLYASSSHGSNNIANYVNTEFLRYYVLIHDEEKDDITKSTALFDLMKRHFGLHCHLLRLRSSQCVETDDDSTKVPPCEWLSAEQEMNQIRTRGRHFFLPFSL